MLKLEGVSYRHAGATADSLYDVSLELPAGRITGLVGASEAGKSTLCLVAAGLAPRVIGGFLRGRISLDGTDLPAVPGSHAPVVIGLQDPSGQLSMVCDTVFEEVAFGPSNLGVHRDELLERVARALDRTGIADLASRDPRHLSGGQQQLVVMAGLLAMQPAYLILDEPLAHLDARSSQRVLGVLEAAAADGTAVLIAEHDTAALDRIAQTVAVIDHGHIVRQGPPAEVLRDAAVIALGIAEPASYRLERLVAVSGRQERADR